MCGFKCRIVSTSLFFHGFEHYSIGSVLEVVDDVHALPNMVQKDVGLTDLFPKLSLHLPYLPYWKNVPALLLVCVC
jgi:hypothetical protein